MRLWGLLSGPLARVACAAVSALCTRRSVDTRSASACTSRGCRLSPEGMPQQANGYDCGVFALMCADRVALDARLDFRQADIPGLRQAVVATLLGFPRSGAL